jgi:hypothetical protein
MRCSVLLLKNIIEPLSYSLLDTSSFLGIRLIGVPSDYVSCRLLEGKLDSCLPVPDPVSSGRNPVRVSPRSSKKRRSGDQGHHTESKPSQRGGPLGCVRVCLSLGALIVHDVVHRSQPLEDMLNTVTLAVHIRAGTYLKCIY